ncbi:MAG: hypothetical protein SCH68_12390, partial [Brevefilum sp.]|nr:hypothetical protein [Brevefilum sp.]
QETFRTAAYALAVEGEYIYILGEAVNYQGELQENDLDLSGGMKDILLVKLRMDGTPVFTALIGGADDDAAYGLAVREGVVYIFGETWSRDFPGAPGNAGENDALLMALAADGSGILWARRFGGSGQDAGRALALHDDVLYLTGITWSGDLLPGAALGDADGFLGRVALDGSLDWLKIFGGRALDAPFDLAVISDEIWVVGQSISRDFGGTHQGEGDAFAARFSRDGEQEFAGMYGGREADIAFAISPNQDGGIFLAGGTRTGNLPGAAGDYSGNYDGFLMAIDIDGELQRTTYFGGTGVDYAYDIERTTEGELFLVGETYSSVFPLGIEQTWDNFGNGDAFIVQINPEGAVINSWLKGGADADRARAGVLTSEGLWLAGGFSTGNLPYGMLVPSSELGSISLPTLEPPIPTATLALTATQQPTETPIPSTPTPQPTTPQTATAAAMNTATAEVERTAVSEVLDSTPTSSFEAGDVPPVDETQTSGLMPGETVDLSPTPTTTVAAELVVDDGVQEEGEPTGIIVGIGLILAAGLGCAYFWFRRNKAKDIP